MKEMTRWEKRYKTISNNHYTTLGVYLDIKDELYEECKKNKIKAIQYDEFVKIVRTYFFIIFTYILDKYATVNLYRFGTLNIMKTIPEYFIPKSYSYIKDKDNKVVFVKTIDLSRTDGFIYYLNWIKPIEYINYKIKFAKLWRKKLMDKIFKYGADYPQYKG